MAKKTIETKLYELSGTLCTLHYKLGIHSEKARITKLISDVVYYMKKGKTI